MVDHVDPTFHGHVLLEDLVEIDGSEVRQTAHPLGKESSEQNHLQQFRVYGIRVQHLQEYIAPICSNVGPHTYDQHFVKVRQEPLQFEQFEQQQQVDQAMAYAAFGVQFHHNWTDW